MSGKGTPEERLELVIDRFADGVEALKLSLVEERRQRLVADRRVGQLEKMITGKDGMLVTQGRIVTQLRFQWWVIGIMATGGTVVLTLAALALRTLLSASP